ncbi:MAG: hypothetical protein ABH882_06340 [Candidatus Omnitrophota bacterium]
MLDWSKIDNEKTFQNLVNHLFFLECPSVFGFVPFSPYIGKDGGWDGKYKGRYPKEDLEGLFCIQAKYTKHNLNDAMPSLVQWAGEELDKAKKNQVDHLRLATCADLRNEHITKIEALNKDHVKTFKIWHGHDLLMRIEREPFLRSYYFDSPAIPLFVPASIYFKEMEQNFTDVDVPGGIKSIEDRINEVITFLNDNKKKTFVLHAFGGFGKTYFLWRFPQKAIEVGLDREIWFIRDGIRDVHDAIQDEIGVRDSGNEKRKYIFVLDDADRAGDTKEILDCINKSGLDAKLIVALRTAGLSGLEETIDSVRCRELTVFTSIPQWSDDELKMLLRTAAQKDQIDDENEIVRKYPNPFFIVRIGLNIRGRSDYDLQRIKAAILESLLNDTRKILSTEQIDVKELLLHLALITPVNKSDSSTIAKLAQKLNVDEQKIRGILEKISKGGVLRAIGSILRFIPDMIGDVYLLETMQTLGEDSRKQVFLYWLDSHSKNIFCNLGATLRYGEKDCLVPVVTDVVSGWINNVDKYDIYEKRRVLENLEEICYLIPDKALDMLWAFMDTPDLNTDAFGPTITRLIHSNCERGKIVKIIEGLRYKVKLGTYDNYKPNTLVREALSPLENSIEKKIMPILTIIEASLKGTEPIIEFSKVALQEVLASAHEWTHSTYESMQFGTRALQATEAVLVMRNKAIEIVKGMLLDARSEVRLAAIDVVEDIGRCHFGPGVSTNIPLRGKIAEEKQEMLEFIAQNNLIKKENDRHVLSSYEDLLISWWAHQDASDEKTLTLFNQIKYDSEYRIFRYYKSRWDISDDVRGQLKNAPTKDRWPWVVDNIMQKKWHLTVEDFEKDAIALNEKYSSPVEIVGFLDWLGKAVTVSSANALFLRAWFKQNPDAFKQIRVQKDLWSKIPLIFKYTITYDLVQKYPEMAKAIIDEVLLTPNVSTDEAKIAIDILSYDIPSLDKYGIIKSVAEKNIDDLNLTILERMRFIGDKISAKAMAEIVLIVLNHLTVQAQAKAVDHIAFILHRKSKEYVNEFLGVTRDVLYLTLLNDNKLDYHDFEIAILLFTEVKELLGFIGSRLEREKEINKYSEYEAVPFHGIEFINKFINTDESYLFAIRKTLEWHKKYEGIINYSVSKIFEQVMSLRDSSGGLYFDHIKAEFYNNNNFPECLQCLFRLPLDKKNLNTFKEILEKSSELRYEDQMIKLLRSKIYPEGGWSSSVGQVPPAFIEKRECFEELKKTAPEGKLRNALDECVRGVEQMIEEHKKEEENRFHSR